MNLSGGGPGCRTTWWGLSGGMGGCGFGFGGRVAGNASVVSLVVVDEVRWAFSLRLKNLSSTNLSVCIYKSQKSLII